MKAHVRRSLVVAMQRLSKNTNLYPTVFTLKDVTMTGNDAIAAGSFADVYRGIFEGQSVCLKMIKVFGSTAVEYTMKVCHLLMNNWVE